MKKLVVLPALALAALMVGCGGSASSSGPASSAAAPAGSSSAPTSASSSATASASSSASASASASGGETADVCGLLSVARVNELSGGSYTTQTKQSNRCTYQAADGSQDDALLTGVKETSESFTALLVSEKKALGGSSKSTDVTGADDAAVVTTKDGSKNVVSVLSKSGDVLYLVIIENSKSTSSLEASATTVMEALIKA